MTHYLFREFTSNSLSFSRIDFQCKIFSIIFFANSLRIHYLFREFTYDSLFRDFTIDLLSISWNHDEFPLIFANSLWIHYLFREFVWIHDLFLEFTLNYPSSRIHSEFPICSEFTICFANSLWILDFLCEFTSNSLSFSRIHFWFPFYFATRLSF